MKKRLNKKGFTLIELIVVIAILAILAAILIPSLTNYIKKATDTKNAANCRSAYSAWALEVAVKPLGTYIENSAEGNVKIDTFGATITSSGEAAGALATFSCDFGAAGVYSAPNFIVP